MHGPPTLAGAAVSGPREEVTYLGRIVTEFVYPPIPDWSAVVEDYEPGKPMGWGRTEREAIEDLVEQLMQRLVEGKTH